MASLKHWARRIRQQALTLYFAAKDPMTPWAARLLALCVVAYAFSPIDLIPDFIPVLGLLDDLILLPLGIALAIRLIPRPIWRAAEEQARRVGEQPKSLVAAVVIVIVWTAIAACGGWWVYRHMTA